MMSELIMPFGIGFILGIVLFLVLERAGYIDKLLGLERAPKSALRGREITS